MEDVDKEALKEVLRTILMSGGKESEGVKTLLRFILCKGKKWAFRWLSGKEFAPQCSETQETWI